MTSLARIMVCFYFEFLKAQVFLSLGKHGDQTSTINPRCKKSTPPDTKSTPGGIKTIPRDKN